MQDYCNFSVYAYIYSFLVILLCLVLLHLECESLLYNVQMLPGFLLVFSAVSGRILYVSENVFDELGHPVVSDTCV